MRTIVTYLVVTVSCSKPSQPPPPTPASGSAAVVPVAVDASVDAIAVVAVDAGPPVDAAPIACNAKAIGQARKEAEAHMKAKRHDAAIEILEHAGRECFLGADQDTALQAQIAWQLSDLSFAYHRAGRHAECYAIAAAQTTPYVGNVGHFFDEDHAVMRALSYNAAQCQKAIDAERGTFAKAVPCPFDDDAFAIPGGGCLKLEASTKDEDDMNACGPVVILRKTKPKRTVLTVEEGNLVNGSVCCNVGTMQFGTWKGATWAVLVMSDGRDCNGGTASSEEQHTYALEGTKLELVHAVRATAH